MYFTQDVEDAALIKRWRAGDETAFESLVRRHERVLFNVALRLVGDRDEAADATQNTFMKVFQKLDTFDDDRRFFSWIYRILVNESLNIRRAHRPTVDGLPSREDPRDGPLEVLEKSERHRRVQAALLALAADYREVVVLRHFGGMSYEEIAVAVGVPEKTVKSRLYTARQRLGELLLGWAPR